MNWINKTSLKTFIWLSLFIHLIGSFFSTGFQHFDEHFQILEFVNLKWGGIRGESLAWEYREKIRPWFQPWLFYLFSYPFKVLGVKNPFFFACYFRILSGVLGWFSVLYFFKIVKIWFKNNGLLQKWGYLLLNFLWYIPFIHVRTSSESLSISLFLIGSALFLSSQKKYQFFLAGILWGLTYHARFQMALPVASLWISYLIFSRKESGSLGRLSLSAVGVIVAIGVGTVIDYWGYGEWSFSLWHYYRTNFQEGILANFKQYPWYWYIRWGFFRGIPPVSLILVPVTFLGWIKYWKHPLTWMTFPLFFFHSLVGHKEVRFLFPCMVITPLFLLFFYRDYQEKIKRYWEKRWLRSFISFCIFVNLGALTVATLKPVNPSVNFYSYLWGNKEVNKIYAKEESPFTMLGLDIEFYKKPNFSVEIWKPNTNFDEKGKFVFLRKGKDFFEYQAKKHCENLFLAYPEWLLHFNVGNWMSRSRVWSLFKCR